MQCFLVNVNHKIMQIYMLLELLIVLEKIHICECMAVRSSVVFLQRCNLAMHMVQMKIDNERYCVAANKMSISVQQKTTRRHRTGIMLELLH